MPTMKQLDTLLKEYNKEVAAKIAANKGGDTFKEVQKVAKAIPAALTYPMSQLKTMGDSGWKGDKAKIPVYFKQLKAQWEAIKLTSVTKYISDHQPGGPKNRANSLLRTAATKKAEADRVELCSKLVQLHGEIDEVMDDLKSPKDFTDLKTQ
jgi:hypothetical protein